MKIIHTPKWSSIGLLLVVLVFSGCKTLPYVGHIESRIEDPSSLQNFIMLPVPNLETDPAVIHVLGDASISILAVKQMLELRGFQYSKFEEADFLVGLRAVYVKADSVEFTGDGLKDLPNTYPGLKSYEIRGDEIMSEDSSVDNSLPSWVLVLEVFNKDPFQLVWSGWCTTHNKRFFDSDENKLLALEMVLKDFPN